MAHGWRRLRVLGLIAGLVCWLPATAGAGPAPASTHQIAITCSGQSSTGFENGTAAPWFASPGVVSNSPAEPPHSGNWDAWMDGYGTVHTDTLSSSISIPSGCQATMTIWLHIDTAETTTTIAYDKLTLKFNTTVVATYSNLNHNTGYAFKSFTVPTGTTSISFTATEDASRQTSFVLDDITITSS
jgi:kumamolisin